MKYLLCLIILISTAQASWRPPTFKSLLKHANYIVIAEFNEVTKEYKDDYAQRQLVSFTIKQSLKGKLKGDIIVSGHKNNVCKPQYYFSNTPKQSYLLFIYGDNKDLQICSGKFGALEIKKDSVKWFKDPQERSWFQVTSPLSKVLQEIKDELKNQEASKDKTAR